MMQYLFMNCIQGESLLPSNQFKVDLGREFMVFSTVFRILLPCTAVHSVSEIMLCTVINNIKKSMACLAHTSLTF